MTDGAFAGVRVIDFDTDVAGALACMLLADHGAEVIRVEPPGRTRDDPGWLCWNRNKQRLLLDPGADRARLDALLASAHAAVFDAPPRGLEALGLDSARLTSAHPALLHLWLPPYGDGDEWAGLPADDALLWAVSGNAFRQFSWDDVPVWMVTRQAQYAHGLLAADALAAALFEQARSGRGQSVVVTGLQAMAAVQAGNAVQPGRVPKLPDRGARGRIPNYRLYRCADGEWLFLAGLMEAHFRAAVRAIGLEALWSLPGVEGKFANVMAPGVAFPVNRLLEARFAEKSRADWLAALRAAGVPAAPVGTREAWFASDAVRANGLRVELEHTRLGTVALPGVSASLAATPGSVRHLEREVRYEDLALAPLRARAAAAAAPAARGPLAGIVVLDLGVIIAGTYAGAILADLGAEVIKVEPLEGDPFRPFGIGFVGWNRGKRGVALDLKRPEALAAFYALVRRADVVCDNYRRGVLERLKLDYDTLRAINPRIVSASVTAYGSAGPFAADPGFDPLLQAQGGLMAAQGGDDEPVFHQVAVHDTASAMVAAFAIVAALFARERSGVGQRVETSLAAQSLLLQSGELVEFRGRAPAPRGVRDFAGPSAARRFYRCSDGWIAIACASEAHEAALAAASDRLAILSRDAALSRLRGLGIPAVPALRHEEIYDHAALRPASFYETFEQPGFGSVTAAASYARFSRTPTRFPRRAPTLGEHSRELLREAGLDDAQIDALAASGALRLG
jgi:crotonobetainyl-CoA:carnitine CoA-transferase CaiB-like acyl-CoA transferase